MWESDRFSSHPNKLLGVRNLCEFYDLDSQTKVKMMIVTLARSARCRREATTILHLEHFKTLS